MLRSEPTLTQRVSIDWLLLQNWLTAAFCISLFTVTVEPNCWRWFSSTEFAKFFAQSPPVQTKAPTTPTSRTAPKVSPKIVHRKVFPIKGMTASSARGIITDKVGSCRPLGRCDREHQGVDYGTRALGKVSILSPVDGKVLKVNPDAKSGGYIAIASNYGGKKRVFRLLHLDREPLRRFKVNQVVKAGELLSHITPRGKNDQYQGSSGDHLHAEIWLIINGQWILDRNPHNFFTW
ncbi:MAG: M23 family metallopeptidase [Moorea sp. SIO4A3]|nr:M23 family metallopeptidase [Moorena sp. SIO4A3]